MLSINLLVNYFRKLYFCRQLYLENERLMETVPCALTSNLRTGSSDLAAFLRRVHSPEVGKWFVHWQNCDINAVKVLRKYYQRPYFLSSTVSPAHFNWVLMSSDYNSPSYKKVELDSGLIALAQLRGATQLRLTPINPCNSSCPELIADLHQGEMCKTLLSSNVSYGIFQKKRKKINKLTKIR